MVSWESKRIGDLLLLANGLVLALVLNQLASLHFFRVDLTEERRYTIKQPTKELLANLDDDVYVEVYLDGDLNAGFRRLQKAVRETLDEFRIFSGNKIHFTFKDPASAAGQKAQSEFMTSLAEKGIQPMNVIDTKDGQRTEKLVFPGALVSYGGMEQGVMLLKGDRAQRSQEVLNQSIEGLEFELANAINKLTMVTRKRVGLVAGHGELDSLKLASLQSKLLESYDVARTRLYQPVDAFDVLIIAKPTRLFSAQDRYALDQYIMRGGKLLLMFDRLDASMDSVSRGNYVAFPYELALEDQLFHYGVRVNLDLVQDRVALRYPVVTGVVNGKPEIMALEWPYFPLINHYADHAATRNLDASALRFVSSIDTVKAEGIRKTPLLMTSPYSRRMAAPVRIDMNELRKDIKPEEFSAGPIAVAYLLEGTFTSAFKNRFLPEGVDSSRFLPQGRPAKIIVVADGDLARNEISNRTGLPQELGLDPVSGYKFANGDLIMNMVAYLSDESGLINARTKEIKIRPLDREKVKNSRALWQAVNFILPLGLVFLFGVLKAIFRKRKYARFAV